MAFNADQFTDAMERPSIIVGGEEYEGVLLGFDEVLELQNRFEELDEDALAPLEDLVRDFCERLEIPADVVLRLPPAAMNAALVDFLASLVVALENE